ncbi:MAG: Xylose isomerase [Bryobacterales bacterium]|jgi:sugar phosphate isomerase/epimerase|nr:Xylose isomerase [Bryobacterales bacterium]
MPQLHTLSRRALLGSLAAIPLAFAETGAKHIPIGLELFSVRGELKKDQKATLQAVAKMGYECVEFFSPYFEWTPEYAKEVRKELDGLGIRCYSTHNGSASFSSAGLTKAIELNQILGAKYVVLAHPGNVSGIDGWKGVVETLNQADSKMQSSGLHAGYHNHDLEWKPVDGQRPIDLLATGTSKGVMLQLDVGTCLETGNDPVAWIEKNPGRIRSLHLKDWSAQKGYRVLFGEGSAKWKPILAAARNVGGAEFFLIEQEGSDYPELETADRCLVAYKNISA